MPKRDLYRHSSSLLSKVATDEAIRLRAKLLETMVGDVFADYLRAVYVIRLCATHSSKMNEWDFIDG